jgi:hypothetical protein
MLKKVKDKIFSFIEYLINFIENLGRFFVDFLPIIKEKLINFIQKIQEILIYAYDRYDWIYVFCVFLVLGLTLTNYYAEHKFFNLNDYSTITYLISSIFIFIAFRKNQKENKELSILLNSQRDFFEQSSSLNDSIKNYQKKLNIVSLSTDENRDKLTDLTNKLNQCVDIFKNLLDENNHIVASLKMVQKELDHQKDQMNKFKEDEQNAHLQLLQNFVYFYDIITKASKVDPNAIHENLKKSLETLKEQSKITQLTTFKPIKYQPDHADFNNYKIHWESTKDDSKVDSIKEILKYPFKYKDKTIQKGEMVIYCADQTQVNEVQTDQTQADQTQADQTQADQAQADQSQADQSQADQAQINEPQADQHILHQ